MTTAIQLIAHADRYGRIITETECGAWTMRHTDTVEDDAGDMHSCEGDGAVTVAALLSVQSHESITAVDVRRCWASVRG